MFSKLGECWNHILEIPLTILGLLFASFGNPPCFMGPKQNAHVFKGQFLHGLIPISDAAC